MLFVLLVRELQVSRLPSVVVSISCQLPVFSVGKSSAFGLLAVSLKTVQIELYGRCTPKKSREHATTPIKLIFWLWNSLKGRHINDDDVEIYFCFLHGDKETSSIHPHPPMFPNTPMLHVLHINSILKCRKRWLALMVLCFIHPWNELFLCKSCFTNICCWEKYFSQPSEIFTDSQSQ